MEPTFEIAPQTNREPACLRSSRNTLDAPRPKRPPKRRAIIPIPGNRMIFGSFILTTQIVPIVVTGLRHKRTTVWRVSRRAFKGIGNLMIPCPTSAWIPLPNPSPKKMIANEKTNLDIFWLSPKRYETWSLAPLFYGNSQSWHGEKSGIILDCRAWISEMDFILQVYFFITPEHSNKIHTGMTKFFGWSKSLVSLGPNAQVDNNV